MRCVAIEGVKDDLAKRMLAILYRQSQQPSAIYRHIWQPGDLLIWDNRVTMHRASHDDVAAPRTLHRGMVAGEIPIPA